MKKIAIILLSSLLFFSAMLKPAQAVDISVGPVLWYAWWSPNFQNYFTENFPGRLKNLLLVNHLQASSPYIDRSSGTWNTKGTFLYGPAVSMKFSENWSLASVFTMNVPYDQSGHVEIPRVSNLDTTPTLRYTKQRFNLKTKKYDLDTTLSYSFFSYLKIFCGFKYQGYSYKGARHSLSDTVQYYAFTYRGNSDGYGAGLGLGTTLPLYDNLYLMGNISAVYLNTRFDRHLRLYLQTISEVQYFDAAGLASSLSLAYHIRAASITVSLGGKFQMLKYYCRQNKADNAAAGRTLDQKIYWDKRTEYEDKIKADGTKDYFYGATLSVTYNFTI